MDESSTPNFERILSVFESAPTGTPFDPAQVAVLVRLQQASRAYYAVILDNAVSAEQPQGALSHDLLRGAQMLNRRVANALAQAVIRQVPRPQRVDEQIQVGEWALASLRARADEIKWHGFEQRSIPRASWRLTNDLVRAVESISMEHQPLTGNAACADEFAHCVMLASLNVGILSAPQLELAHRWLCISAREMRVDRSFRPETHYYRIDLAKDHGPERIAAAGAASETTRFLAVAALGAKLAQTRAELYAGQLVLGMAASQRVALHLAAFLDLAERLWSPDWRRTTLRGEREKLTGVSIEVVTGLGRVLATLRGDADPAAEQTPPTWVLHDRSDTGLGARMALDSGVEVPIGELIAVREAGADRWELGCVVRRVLTADGNLWCVGIRRLSPAPVAIELTPWVGAGVVAPLPTEAIYAPINAQTGRIDSLVIAAGTFGLTSEFLLPTGGGNFHVRANRVIDRGEQWVRVGFEVLGKESAARTPRTATG